MPVQQPILSRYLPHLLEISPVMRFVRMDDPSITPWAFQSASIYKAICNLDASVSIWSAPNGVSTFDVPKDAVRMWQIGFDHITDTLDVLTTSSHAYITADSNPSELGKDGHPHPERAFKLNLLDWNDIIFMARIYIDIDRYPVAVDKMTLKKRMVNAPLDLRCIPSEADNVPILTLHKSSEMFVSPPLYPEDKPEYFQALWGGVIYWAKEKK